MASALHRQEPQFLRRNTFVHGCLGLLSLAERAELLIVEGAVAGAKLPPESAPEPTASEGDEAVTFALLGALRLARELRARLAADAPSSVPAPRTPPLQPEPRLRDLLR